MISCLFVGRRQPVPAAVSQGLHLLQELWGQSIHLGDALSRSWRVLAQSQPDTTQVGLPRTHIWAWCPA